MHQPKIDFNKKKKKIHQTKLDMQQRIKNSPKEMCGKNLDLMEERKTKGRVGFESGRSGCRSNGLRVKNGSF